MTINRINIDPIFSLLSSGATVIVPNNRLKEAVEQNYADRQERNVFHTPAVLGIDVWVRERWEQAASLGIAPFCERQVVSGSEELFIWIEIIEDSLTTYPLLNPEETAIHVSHAYQLMKQWQLHTNKPSEFQLYSAIPDIAAFLIWCEKFAAICEERKIISLVDCIELITQHLAASQNFPLPDSVVLLNFFQPPPLYAELFDALGELVPLETVTTGAQSTTLNCTHHMFQDKGSEFQFIANWALEVISKEPEAHIGILGELVDDQRDELERLLSNTLSPQHIVEFNASESLFNSSHNSHSLLDEAHIHDAFLLFQLAYDEQDAEEFCRLLRSPFVLPDSTEQRAKAELEKELRHRVTNRCRTQDLSFYANREGKSYYCPEFATAMLNARERFRRFPQTASPDKWRGFLLEVLEGFDWPGSQLTTAQRTSLRRFDESLEQVGALTPIVGEMEFPKLLSRLRNLCRRSKHRQQFDNRCQISVYSMTEATGLQFDHVWLLNFNDQVWPPPISPSPFLPYALQKELQLPGSHTDVQLKHAKDTFNIVSSSVLGSLQSSHHHSDGEQEFRSSSFARDFPVVKHEENHSENSITSYSNLIAEKPVLKIALDDAVVPFTPGEASVGGHSVLSDQASCPFHAFILHRLHARPLPYFETGLNRAARGTAMHEALDFLFTRIQDQNSLAKLSDASKLELCEEAAGHAIDYLSRFHQALMTPRFSKIEGTRLSQLLNKFLEVEKSRSEYSVLATEQAQTWRYRDMTFNLKIDRIDRLSDGSLAVIDYKTGKRPVTPSSWLSERPQDLQLPFYLTATQSSSADTVSAVAIAHVNPERTDYSGVMKTDEFHSSLISVDKKLPGDKNWEALSQYFEQTVLSIADEFRDGIASIYPGDYSEQVGNYQISALCRVPQTGVLQTRVPQVADKPDGTAGEQND